MNTKWSVSLWEVVAVLLAIFGFGYGLGNFLPVMAANTPVVQAEPIQSLNLMPVVEKACDVTYIEVPAQPVIMYTSNMCGNLDMPASNLPSPDLPDGKQQNNPQDNPYNPPSIPNAPWEPPVVVPEPIVPVEPPVFVDPINPSPIPAPKLKCNNGVGNGPDCPPPGLVNNGKTELGNKNNDDASFCVPGSPCNNSLNPNKNQDTSKNGSTVESKTNPANNNNNNNNNIDNNANVEKDNNGKKGEQKHNKNK